MQIALISDTHGLLADDVVKHLDGCDEIWHAGDIGTEEIIDRMKSIAPIRAVLGNIDPKTWKNRIPIDQYFKLNGLQVYMTHIGGYPGRYTRRVSEFLDHHPVNLYICGHSHILKVMRDKRNDTLHMNPGACGIHGFHKFRTMLKFDIQDGRIENLVAIDLGPRSAIRRP